MCIRDRIGIGIAVQNSSNVKIAKTKKQFNLQFQYFFVVLASTVFSKSNQNIYWLILYPPNHNLTTTTIQMKRSLQAFKSSVHTYDLNYPASVAAVAVASSIHTLLGVDAWCCFSPICFYWFALNVRTYACCWRRRRGALLSKILKHALTGRVIRDAYFCTIILSTCSTVFCENNPAPLAAKLNLVLIKNVILIWNLGFISDSQVLVKSKIDYI